MDLPFKDDPHRPQFHFQPPANWMNDPNGLIQWRDRYHMFYQHNPEAATWGPMHWGHAVSGDMVHWTHLPVALAPTPGGPDGDGCWSGCAVDHDGVPTLVYTGVHPQCQCLAVPRDEDDEHLRQWVKHPRNPVIAAPPPGMETVGFRDPCVWREGNTWYAAIGSGIRGVGGAILLYRSPNLVEWEYLHPILTGDQTATQPLKTGSMWECPSFFRLDDRHVLIMSAMDDQDSNLRYTAYMTGIYGGEHVFSPQFLGKLDLGDELFYAPQTLLDGRGRRIMWGWIQEGRSREAQMAAGWAGVMSLPRVLTMRPDGRLDVRPTPEVNVLRRARRHLSDLHVTPNSPNPLDGVWGDVIEIVAELAPGKAQAGVKVRCSPDGEEETVILYDPEGDRLIADRTRSSLDDDVTRDVAFGALDLPRGESLRLHIYVDRSVIEVFANGHTCLTTRVYPTRPDSLGVAVTAREGEATLTSLDVWEMRSIWAQ